MHDRSGDDTPAIVDFDSRRRVREEQTAIQRAREQRERLAETRTVHAPLSSDQADATRSHRRAVTDRADGQRNKLRIANCQLCDDDGYTPGHVVCDHREHYESTAHGRGLVREMLESIKDRRTRGGRNA